MLVLLIIFMVAAPLLATGVPSICRRPRPALNIDQKPLSIAIDEKGDDLPDGPAGDVEQLVDKLKDAAKAGLRRAHLCARLEAVNYGQVAEIMSLITTAGLQESRAGHRAGEEMRMPRMVRFPRKTLVFRFGGASCGLLAATLIVFSQTPKFDDVQETVPVELVTGFSGSTRSSRARSPRRRKPAQPRRQGRADGRIRSRCRQSPRPSATCRRRRRRSNASPIPARTTAQAARDRRPQARPPCRRPRPNPAAPAPAKVRRRRRKAAGQGGAGTRKGRAGRRRGREAEAAGQAELEKAEETPAPPKPPEKPKAKEAPRPKTTSRKASGADASWTRKRQERRRRKRTLGREAREER